MLQITVDKVAEVIIISREGRRGEAELEAFVENLNEDEQASLVALMWIGRESFEPDQLEEAKRQAALEATAPTEDYLTGIPALAEYLEDGMDALGIDVATAEDEL